MTNLAVRKFRPQKAAGNIEIGGMLVVCGPPLGGKGPLAALVAEALPCSIKLESTDNLSREEQSYAPIRQQRSGAASPEQAILQDAAGFARQSTTASPLIVICARFPTQQIRRSAADLARSLGMRFLLVEATSSSIRSLRRVSQLMLPSEETLRRIARYEKGRAAYKPVSQSERTRLPAVRLKAVLSNLDLATTRVLQAWSAH